MAAHQARVENDMHEMDKPLARDKNDEDLDAHLKAVEREEDPMLKYIRKKQTKAKVASGIPRKWFLRDNWKNHQLFPKDFLV